MAIDCTAIGQRLRGIRKKRGLTQQILSEMIHVSPTHISFIETGRKCMSLETMVDVCNALRISPDDLLLDNLEYTAVPSNHLFADLVADCTVFETRVLLGIIPATKDAIRKNTSFFTNRHISLFYIIDRTEKR